MGVAFWKPEVRIEAEEVTVAFEKGSPSTVNGKRFASRSSCSARATRSAGATAWA